VRSNWADYGADFGLDFESKNRGKNRVAGKIVQNPKASLRAWSVPWTSKIHARQNEILWTLPGGS
jgi:hypothetical protein